MADYIVYIDFEFLSYEVERYSFIDVISSGYVVQSTRTNKIVKKNSCYDAPFRINLSTRSISDLNIQASRKCAQKEFRQKPQTLRTYLHHCNKADQVRRRVLKSEPINLKHIIPQYLNQKSRIVFWNGKTDERILRCFYKLEPWEEYIFNVTTIKELAEDDTHLLLHLTREGYGEDVDVLHSEFLGKIRKRGCSLNLYEAHGIGCNRHHGVPHNPDVDCVMTFCLINQHLGLLNAIKC